MSQKPLDWNWRPEMQRDSFVNNWVGREFVKPFRGTTPMRPLTWKEHMQHPWHAAAIAEAAKKADAVPAGVPQKDVAEAETKAEEAEAASPRSMQGLLPLKYFPHSGMGEYDTAYIMKQAQESVARAKIDPTKVEERSLGYVRPRSDGADEGGTPAPAPAEKSVEEQPEPGAAVEEAVESQKQPSTKREFTHTHIYIYTHLLFSCLPLSAAIPPSSSFSLGPSPIPSEILSPRFPCDSCSCGGEGKNVECRAVSCVRACVRACVCVCVCVCVCLPATLCVLQEGGVLPVLSSLPFRVSCD